MSCSPEETLLNSLAPGARVQDCEAIQTGEWEAARAPATLAHGGHAAELGASRDLRALAALAWPPGRVPGTAAAALAAAGEWKLGQEHDFDAEDWWFRTRIQ